MKKYFLLALLFSQTALALDLSPAGLYQATKEACEQVHPEDLNTLQFDKLRAGYFPSQQYTEMLAAITRESARAASHFNFQKSKMALYIAGDAKAGYQAQPEFTRALAECYPSDQRMQNFFVDSIDRSDSRGKSAAIGLFLVLYKGTGTLTGLITKWSQTATTLLNWTNRTYFAALGTSMLNSDTTPNDSTHPKRIQTTDIQAMQSSQETELQNNLESLRRQILEAQEKIKSCGQCPELQKLESSSKFLSQILESNLAAMEKDLR